MQIENIAQFEKTAKYVNTFYVEALDKDGNVIMTEEIENAVTNEGMNSILNTYFGASTKPSAWYIGLIDNAGYTGVDVADTLASHAGWSEFTNYDEATRQDWTPTTSTAQSVTGSAVSTFTISTGGGAIKGLFVATVATGTSGLLWATALFSSVANVVDAETFRVTYTVRLSN